MRDRIQRAAMLGLVLVAGLTAGACLAQPGMACGDSWCPEGYLCTPVDRICIKSECGNGFVEAGEECDDGNLDDEDNCLSTCKLNTCGDGKVNPWTEECDDGNLDDEDDCLSTCKLNRCGDGKVNPRTEECDDGNLDDEDDCLSTCKLSRCGDGKVNPRTEECEDGNTRNDDGCNNDCTVSLRTYIKASNTGAYDEFGYSVALSADGSTLAVGAWQESSAATGVGGSQGDNTAGAAGAVYVFTRSGRVWSQQAYIKASNTGFYDLFGSSVALSADGSTLAVGAIRETSAATGIDGDEHADGYDYAGAVYVFTRSGRVWSQQAYIKASNTGSYHQFGHSVALSADGSTLAVGAWQETSAATGIDGDEYASFASSAGAVYVFTRSGTVWSQQAYVKASNTGSYDLFGSSVALSADGSTLAVGGPGEASAATGIDGDEYDNSDPDAGAVYVFTRSGTVWSQQAYVKASDTGAYDGFGHSVALSADGSTLAAGADGQDSGVYVFTRSGAMWSQQASIHADAAHFRDVALSADGSTLVASAIGASPVYVFTRSGATWSQQASSAAASVHFGHSYALSADGSTLAVGDDDDSSAATGIGDNQADTYAVEAGAVYVYPLLAAPAPAGSVPGGRFGPYEATPVLSSHSTESSALVRF